MPGLTYGLVFQEDDLETLHIGYISFSENKISKGMALEYMLYILLKYREPRFLEVRPLGFFRSFQTYAPFFELMKLLSVSNVKSN